MAQQAIVSEIVFYEVVQGQRTAVRRAKAEVYSESSARTIESIDPLLRAAFGLSEGSRLRSRREDWDVRRRCVHFSVGDLTRKRHFEVEFPGPMPEWSECDW